MAWRKTCLPGRRVPRNPCSQEHGMSLEPTILQHLQVPSSQDQSGRCQVPLEHWERRQCPAPEATGGHPSALTNRVSQEKGCLKTELGDLCCHSNREGSQGWQASFSGKDTSPKGRNILPRVPVTSPLRNTRPGFSKHCLSTWGLAGFLFCYLVRAPPCVSVFAHHRILQRPCNISPQDWWIRHSLLPAASRTICGVPGVAECQLV